MSTIKFTFEDLCAFFTRYSSRLLVGMIATDGEAPENSHQPRIIIKENGVNKREYRGFAEINGDISLEVLPKGRPLSRHVPSSARDPRRPFSLLVDIEKDLHPKEKLHVDPRLCRARLYFKNGELYTTHHLVNIRFADLETNQPCENAPLEIAAKVGLEVEIPEGGYAVLRFSGETEDFVFKGGRNYEVEVTNQADSIQFDHFKYFYNIVRSKPKHRWAPVSAQSTGLPIPRAAGDPLCIPGRFGSTIWDWIISKFTPRAPSLTPKS